MKRCPQCGTENADDNQFCISCGTRMPAPEQEDTGPVGGLPEGPLSVGQPEGQPTEPPTESRMTEEPAVSETPAQEPQSLGPGAPPPGSSLPPVMPPQSVTPPTVTPPPMPGTMPYAAPVEKQSQLGLISMILGIVSIVLNCGCWMISWLVGIAAIVLGVLAKRDRTANQGMATAGIITGVIGLLFGIAIIIFFVVFGVFGNGGIFHQINQGTQY